jgi:hypothetical protein
MCWIVSALLTNSVSRRGPVNDRVTMRSDGDTCEGKASGDDEPAAAPRPPIERWSPDQRRGSRPSSGGWKLHERSRWIDPPRERPGSFRASSKAGEERPRFSGTGAFFPLPTAPKKDGDAADDLAGQQAEAVGSVSARLDATVEIRVNLWRAAPTSSSERFPRNDPARVARMKWLVEDLSITFEETDARTDGRTDGKTADRPARNGGTEDPLLRPVSAPRRRGRAHRFSRRENGCARRSLPRSGTGAWRPVGDLFLLRDLDVGRGHGLLRRRAGIPHKDLAITSSPPLVPRVSGAVRGTDHR